MNYSTPTKLPSPKTAKSKKFSDGAIDPCSQASVGFADFVLTLSVYPNARGKLVADLKSMIGAGLFPKEFFGWNDFYSFLAYHHRTSPETIEIARALWRQYSKREGLLNKGASPASIDEARS